MKIALKIKCITAVFTLIYCPVVFTYLDQSDLPNFLPWAASVAGAMVAMAFFAFSGLIEQAISPGNDR